MSEKRKRELTRKGQPARPFGTWDEWEKWSKKSPQARIRKLKERIMRPVLDDPDFQADLEAARSAYLADPQGFVLADAILELRGKHRLSLGWTSWLGHYIVDGKSEPIFLHLWRTRIKEDGAGQKYAQVDVYFPLPGPALLNLTETLEYKAGEFGFGYFEQEQVGGRPKGKSGEAKRKHLALAQDYWNTVDEYKRLEEVMLNLADFAESRGTSVSTVERSLKLWDEEKAKK